MAVPTPRWKTLVTTRIGRALNRCAKCNSRSSSGVHTVRLRCKTNTLRAKRSGQSPSPSTQSFRIPTTSFSERRENVLKPSPAINHPDQTRGFGHVGIDHQPDLSPVLPEISRRRGEASAPLALSVRHLFDSKRHRPKRARRPQRKGVAIHTDNLPGQNSVRRSNNLILNQYCLQHRTALDFTGRFSKEGSPAIISTGRTIQRSYLAVQIYSLV